MLLHNLMNRFGVRSRSPDERSDIRGLICDPAYRYAHAGYEHDPSRNVIAPAAPNPIRLVEKITSVTQRRFGILIDRNDDRLHMRVAPAFPRRLDTDFGQGFYPWRIIRVVVVPSERS
jgi:hypothetical protein